PFPFGPLRSDRFGAAQGRSPLTTAPIRGKTQPMRFCVCRSYLYTPFGIQGSSASPLGLDCRRCSGVNGRGHRRWRRQPTMGWRGGGGRWWGGGGGGGEGGGNGRQGGGGRGRGSIPDTPRGARNKPPPATLVRFLLASDTERSPR